MCVFDPCLILDFVDSEYYTGPALHRTLSANDCESAASHATGTSSKQAQLVGMKPVIATHSECAWLSLLNLRDMTRTPDKDWVESFGIEHRSIGGDPGELPGPRLSLLSYTTRRSAYASLGRA